MTQRRWLFAVALVLSLVVGSVSQAASLKDGLKQGTPDIKSISQLAFGPEGVLFLGDTRGAAVFAIDTQDTTKAEAGSTLKIPNVNEKFASALGIESKQLSVTDLAVNPVSHQAYVSVTRGTGPDSQPVLLRVNNKGKISEVNLKDVKFSKVELPNPSRRYTITDIQYSDNHIYVAGLSTDAWASALYTIPVPFKKAIKGTNVEIYHGAHGKYETRSPVQTFVPFEINGSAHLLAAYTCTPLVKFPVSELKPGARVRGTTIAELGNRNRPLDIVVYNKGKQDYLLIANSSRGVMKVTTQNIDKIEPLTSRVSRGGTAGLKFETIKDLEGVVQLAKLSDSHALVITQEGRSGPQTLRAVELP